MFLTGGARGNYYFHNGRWRRSDPDNRGFLGGVMGFPGGIDAVLLLNIVDLDLRISTVLREAYDASFSR